jgi:3-oxoadipate enol-lactonase
MQTTDLTIKANNILISYDDIGIGAIPAIPIIFIHGFPFDKSMWSQQMEFFKPTNRVIAYDLRGFGRSSVDTAPWSLDLFVTDLLSFMDALKIPKAILCGFSMGGYIALQAMKKNQDRFEALVLCDTQCIPDSPEAKEGRYKAIEKIKAEGITQFGNDFIKKVFHEDSLTEKKPLVEDLKKIVLANTKEAIIGGLTALAERSDSCYVLNKITIPTLIICGREDQVTPLKESEFMHENIQDSTLHAIHHAGHVANLEQPVMFNKHLADFLSVVKSLAASDGTSRNVAL